MLCWWSLELETNSKRALLWGKGGWGQKRPCVHWPQNTTFRQLGREAPKTHLRKGTKLASGSCIGESESLLGKTKLSPNAFFLRIAALSGFSPLLAIGTRSVWAAFCSLCTGAVLVVAGAGNQLQTCSRLGRRWIGPERPCVHWPHQPRFCHLGRDPPRAHLRKGTKLASGSCVHESQTRLWIPSSAPMSVCSAKQRFLVSPLAHCSP